MTTRQSDRAAATRQALLTAAREVFAGAGFTDASITDVVAKAGASVGSLYHHFGGKADLYLALFEDFSAGQEERAAAAVAAAKATGVTDPIALFAEGTRAFLDGCWEQRDVARLFLAGGGPAGFELVARKRYREWTRINASLLGPLDADEVTRDVLVLCLTSVVSEAGVEVSVCDSEDRARRIVAEVLTLLRKLA